MFHQFLSAFALRSTESAKQFSTWTALKTTPVGQKWLEGKLHVLYLIDGACDGLSCSKFISVWSFMVFMNQCTDGMSLPPARNICRISWRP